MNQKELTVMMVFAIQRDLIHLPVDEVVEHFYTFLDEDICFHMELGFSEAIDYLAWDMQQSIKLGYDCGKWGEQLMKY